MGSTCSVLERIRSVYKMLVDGIERQNQMRDWANDIKTVRKEIECTFVGRTYLTWGKFQ